MAYEDSLRRAQQRGYLAFGQYVVKDTKCPYKKLAYKMAWVKGFESAKKAFWDRTLREAEPRKMTAKRRRMIAHARSLGWKCGQEIQ